MQLRYKCCSVQSCFRCRCWLYIDLSAAPVSGGTCQTDLIVMWHALRGTEYSLNIDINKIRESEEVFKRYL